MTGSEAGIPQQTGLAAFEQLYRNTRVQVLGYLLRRTGDADDAADLLAEVYLTAWRRIDDLPSGDAARLWLYGAARRLLANHHRRRTTYNVMVDALRTELAVRPLVDADDGLTEVLETALAQLDATDREIVMLSIWEQLTPAEIAIVTNRSPGNIRVRLHRARRQLRLALPHDSGERKNGRQPQPIATTS